MARALWSGSISFGLLNIPVQLMSGEKRTDLRFHLMDTRNKARVRYERINAETGEEVPWHDIVKAFEYKKGDYVVLEASDLKAAAPQSSESVDIESFIPADAVPVEYFERPYYLLPPKKAAKSYVLLRETLKQLKRVGLARVVIRTREYLALVMPRDDALMLMVLRYPQEIVPVDEYAFPDGSLSDYKLGKREVDMARQLVESMTGEWQPKEYRDEFRAKLSKVIEERMRHKGSRIEKPEQESAQASDKVVDLMAVLRQSLDKRGSRRAGQASPAARSARHGKSKERRRA
jgi:DNA end-binding protein Ku